MSAGRAVRWDFEIPVPDAVEIVTRFTQGSYDYLGLAIDAIDGVEEGQHRIALTLDEARDLHAALGAALADEHSPTKS